MTEAQKQRLDELNKALLFCDADEFNALYDEYALLTDIQQNEFRESAEPQLREYYNKHIAGQTWETVNKDRWDFYSDWHKDVYGYRPRSLSINAENR